ncbi:MAG: hypothetical protein NTY47_07355, partial [Candidatus Omnitrophica bacterium]|nr:hypothetical protein [Candidatus Omnitrophota bacterium]
MGGTQHPISQSIVSFIKSRFILAVWSSNFGHSIGTALGQGKEIGFVLDIYASTSALASLPLVGGWLSGVPSFLSDNLAPTWAGHYSTLILVIVLSTNLIQQAKQLLLNANARRFGLQTADLDALFGQMKSPRLEEYEKTEVFTGMMVAYSQGRLYSKSNPYLFNLLSEPLYLTDILGINPEVLKDFDQGRLAYDKDSYNAKSLRYTFAAGLIYVLNITYFIWPIIAAGVAVILIAVIILNKTVIGSQKLDAYLQVIPNTALSFFSSYIGLATIGMEIAIAQGFAEFLGGPMEILVGPWEGSKNSATPFHNPILNIGGDIFQGLKSGLETGVNKGYFGWQESNFNIDLPAYLALGGAGSIEDMHALQDLRMKAMGMENISVDIL